MALTDAASGESSRIADRLTAGRRDRFVGRRAELDLFRAALLVAAPPFVVLHIYGPGGVGKTTLLREYARVAAEAGRPVMRLDGRAVDPTPVGFLLGLRQLPGLEGGELSATAPDWPRNGVLLIDTYETLAPLDTWLRETFLPQLPAPSLVVIAGRNPPSSAWRTDIDWADLTQSVSLRNLSPDESKRYLTARGVPADRHADVLAFTHGHPLALALVVDVLRRGDRLAASALASEPDVVRVLLERLVQDIPSADHRLALAVCSLVWATTESLLADVVDGADAHTLFEWLRQLSFIDHGPYGLFPHDLAREVLSADLRWRNPDEHQRPIRRLVAALATRLERAHGVEQQRLWFDLLSLTRHHPFFTSYFAWDALESAYAEVASPDDDHAAILEMVKQHEGSGSVQIARYWLGRQPAAFLVFRATSGGHPLGFMAQLALHQATSQDSAVDPAVGAALAFVQRRGPLRPGEELAHLRFWMSRDAYQGVSPALNLAAIHSSIFWTTRPRLAWNLIATADLAFHERHFHSIHMWRAAEADFDVDGRRYAVFAHDWRVEPVAAWLSGKAELASPSVPSPPPRQAAEAAHLLVLDHPAYAAAVRQALRDYTRPDRLATNPLLRTRLLAGPTGQTASPSTLQALLREAVATLLRFPRDLKFHRAIWHTYIELASTQERAAELLDLPFNTYRYHLAQGIARIIAWLWQRELTGTER